MVNINKMKPNEKFVPGVIAPDPRDYRDILLSSVVPLRADYPEVIDCSKYTIISHQYYGTCTSHGSSGVAESQESYTDYQKQVDLASKFVYIKTKEISGLWNTQGDYLRNALKALEKFGAPFESDFPDKPMGNWAEYVKTPIPESVEEKARTHKIKGYARVGKTLDDFMSGMWTTKSPVATGMMWYESYRNIKVDGKLPLPDGKEIGGHAVRADKIDFKEEKVWFPNSWGTSWGNKGYFYIPFKEFNQHNIWDCWVVYPLDNSIAKSMKKIIGDKRDKKQYLVGDDKKLRWIFNETILDELHNAGIINKSEVEWVDNLDGYEIGRPWASIA